LNIFSKVAFAIIFIYPVIFVYFPLFLPIISVIFVYFWYCSVYYNWNFIICYIFLQRVNNFDKFVIIFYQIMNTSTSMNAQRNAMTNEKVRQAGVTDEMQAVAVSSANLSLFLDTLEEVRQAVVRNDNPVLNFKIYHMLDNLKHLLLRKWTNLYIRIYK